MPKSGMMCSSSLKYDIFNLIAFLAKSLLGYAADGTSFLTSASALELGYFILGVIPPIIFFIAFVQWAIGKFATVFFYTVSVSGAEAVVAAASPFSEVRNGCFPHRCNIPPMAPQSRH